MAEGSDESYLLHDEWYYLGMTQVEAAVTATPSMQPQFGQTESDLHCVRPRTPASSVMTETSGSKQLLAYFYSAYSGPHMVAAYCYTSSECSQERSCSLNYC